MAAIVIVAHAPLASALQAVGVHAYPECRSAIHALDVPADWAGAQQAFLSLLALLKGQDVLVLVDSFGATPCNDVLAVIDRVPRVRVLAGVNVPMLWRALSYRELGLDGLAERAMAGATQGVMPAAATSRQNQPLPPMSDDPDQHHDQQ